ncbi:hypothetical protein [Actimicrobium sp. CCI2.3]|uniref:hypothetical protein n=1 Tax=Actimicrobium sp. CCI2.3 TaxID=3048616 RepID=UPI002AB53A80|nr:hypothetical protein [Actimicrobium sp. CCI2.3]MDY7576227.1 hypothetical protein [Actimicrobium sp. CCI2.3]MEB0020568.1 hypothetical protein [Actimicrobium sp. CCI2.3]
MSATPLTGASPAIQRRSAPPSTSVVASTPLASNTAGSPLVVPAHNTMRKRFIRLLNTKLVPHLPARRFDATWPTVAGDICQEWVKTQAEHNETTVSLVALSRMKALEYERKNLATIHEDQRLLPANATKADYYEAEIDAFLAAVGEPDPQAVLESFKLAGSGGLHRQQATIGSTISNSLSAAALFTPDPVSKLALVATRALTQMCTSAAVIAAGPRRFRNACTEDIIPLGRADASAAAKRAPNMLQASLGVMRTLKIKDVTKSLKQMEVAMEKLERARDGCTVKARQDTREQLELAFARICHQLSVKTAYKTSSESAKIEFIGNLRYLMSSYTGTAAVLTASMIAVMTPVFIDAVVTGGLIAAATILTVVMYLGYQLGPGPSRDGEDKAKRAIVALVKMLEVLAGENSRSTRQRGEAYADYLQNRKVPRLTRPAERKRIRKAALATLQDRLEAIAAIKPPPAGLDLATNFGIYSKHIQDAKETVAEAEKNRLTEPVLQQQLSDLDTQFGNRHRNDFAVAELVAAWKTPMRIRMDAASRIVKGRVAQSTKRLLKLKSAETATTWRGGAGQIDRRRLAIELQEQDLRKRLCDLFNLELALQELKLAAGTHADSVNQARARERIAAITDTDVQQLFCGNAEEQVEAIKLSKELTAGESERYTHANTGLAAFGIALNLGVAGADIVVNVGKATNAYRTLQFNDYKLIALSQAGAAPGAHQSAGDRAAFQLREMQKLLAETELKEPAPVHRVQLALEGNVVQPGDAAVDTILHKLVKNLGESDVVPRALHLTLQHASPAAASSAGRAIPVSAVAETEVLAVDLKPTRDFHRVQYKKNPFRQRMRHIRHQMAVIWRQTAMSIAGLPVQAFAQHRVRKAAPTLATAAASRGRAQALLRPTMFDRTEVPVNESGVKCLENRHVVMVQAGTPEQAPHPIHAHKIRQQLHSKAAYAAGQSPQHGSVDNVILQGLESGQGIFQFVSRMAHYDPRNSRETPVIGMLLKQLGQPQGRLIGGRYRVMSFNRIDEKSSHRDFLRHELVAEDTWSASQQVIRVPITQAGLQFSDRLLREQEIRRASVLLDEHNKLLTQPADALNADKMILSFAGIGRNATLITYRVLRDAINDGKVTEESLDFALDAEISPNRVRRGPHYVHTQEQRTELRKALLDWINNPDRTANAKPS